jgi:arylsulfatase A-like enzyme
LSIKIVDFCAYSLLAILSIHACQQPDKNASTSQPNILFIAVDDLRPELGCYGAQHIHSPNIDALAAKATLFNNSYCNIPVCGASRASILTGLRPTMTRFKVYYTRADEDAPDAETLPGVFKKNGYTTISNGKVLHVREDSKSDWDEIWRGRGASPRDYLTQENQLLDSGDGRGNPVENIDVKDTAYVDGKTLLKSIEDLKQLKDSHQPFFLAVGFLKPHLPFNAPKKYWDLYNRDEIKLPENRFKPTDVPKEAWHTSGELRHYNGVPEEGPVSDSLATTLIHGYYACVSYTDALVGQLLQALNDLGLAKNTIVVLWGDHGWNLYEHGLWCKHSNYRTSLKAPLIVKIPDQQQGFARKEMVEFVDIYPTLVDLCGIEAPSHLQGNSLRPLLNNSEDHPWKDRVESVWHNGFTYTTDHHTYTEWRSQTDSIEGQMLFDHQSDPDENINIVDQKESQSVIDTLSPIF